MSPDFEKYELAARIRRMSTFATDAVAAEVFAAGRDNPIETPAQLAYRLRTWADAQAPAEIKKDES